MVLVKKKYCWLSVTGRGNQVLLAKRRASAKEEERSAADERARAEAAEKKRAEQVAPSRGHQLGLAPTSVGTE